MVCERHLHRKPTSARSFLCMLYCTMITTRPAHTKQLIPYMQDKELFQSLWSRAHAFRPTWLEGDHVTYKNFPPCSRPPPHQSEHQHLRLAHCQKHLLSNAVAATQLLSSQGWVSHILLGVGGSEESVKNEEGDGTSSVPELGVQSGPLPGIPPKHACPEPLLLLRGPDPGPTCQNHWICLLFLV